MERSKASTKKKSQRPIIKLSKYNNNKRNIVVFYKKWKEYNEIQLTKYKMDLNNPKIKNHPHSLMHEIKSSQRSSYSSGLPGPRSNSSSVDE